MKSGHCVGTLLLTSLLLTGCAKVRHPANYVLTLAPPAPRVGDPQVSLGPVLVREFRCPDYLCQGRIVYRPAPEEVGYYEYHRWAADPRELITKHVADAVRNEKVFAHVATWERGVQPAYILAGSIDRLEEIDDERHVRVVCALSAQLIDAQSGAVIWSDVATETLSVDQRDVAGVVRSLSYAVQATVDALTKSVARQIVSNRTNGD